MIQSLKKKKHTYEVIRNDLKYNIEKIIIVKYCISKGKSFSNSKWDEIINQNKYYYYDRISKNKLKKLITKKELKDFLIKQNATSDIIEKLINKYEAYNYINDENYVDIYIDKKIDKQGPKLIKEKLIQKGIPLDIVELKLTNIDEKNILSKHIKDEITKNKKRNQNQFKNYILNKYSNKGYSKELIIDLVISNVNNENINDINLIEREYNLIISKHPSIELIEIKKILFNKGYKEEDINWIINKRH